MRYTASIGRYFGIPVRVHITFPLILVVVGVEAIIRSGWLEALSAVALVLAVFVCVVLHEYGHSLQARRYGVRVRDIVLLPIGGMARADRIPDRPREEIMVAIAGPVVNFVLAAVFYAIIRLRGTSIDGANEFLVSLLAVNLMLGTFNLVPAFPMDGGRILRALFATRMAYVDATRRAKHVGQFIAVIFAIIGFVELRLIMLVLIAVFIFYGAISEERAVRVRAALGGMRARDFVRSGLGILAHDGTVESARAHLEGCTDAFALPVTTPEGALSGVAEAAGLREALDGGEGEDGLRGHIKTGFPRLQADTPAAHTYYLMRSRRVPLAGVFDGDRFVGLVFLKDVSAAVA